MDDVAVRAAAKKDADALPLTKKQMASMKRTPPVKVLRRALGLTQEEFSARFQIPLGTLRDWEQGRAQPDLPTRAYLKVIARDPDLVRKALQPV
jgi:putative transcriptional regulator